MDPMVGTDPSAGRSVVRCSWFRLVVVVVVVAILRDRMAKAWSRGNHFFSVCGCVVATATLSSIGVDGAYICRDPVWSVQLSTRYIPLQWAKGGCR